MTPIKSIIIKSYLVAAVSVIGLVGCAKSSDNGGGGPQPVAPLSDADQKRFDQTADNVAKVTDWNKKPGLEKPEAGSKAVESVSVNPVDKTKEDLNSNVTLNCNVDSVKPIEQVQPKPGEPLVFENIGGMSLTGIKCPIKFSFLTYSKTSINLENGDANIVIKMNLEYAPAQAEAKVLDIQSYKFKMDGAVSDGQKGKTGTLLGEGEIISVSQGKIGFTMSGTVSGTNQDNVSTSVATLIYPDGLKVELKEIATQKGKVTESVYFINGKSVDEKLFKKYESKLGFERVQSKSESKS